MAELARYLAARGYPRIAERVRDDYRGLVATVEVVAMLEDTDRTTEQRDAA